MKTTLAFPVALFGAMIAGISSTPAQTMDHHTIVTPQEVKWGPAPAVLPPGAEIAIIYGDPSKEGLFAMRARFPKGYAVAPHTHPKPETVTVLSGTFKVGMGETADENEVEPLTSGTFLAIEPDAAHYVFIDEETEIQINSNGPWGLDYVNPADDPRKTE